LDCSVELICEFAFFECCESGESGFEVDDSFTGSDEDEFWQEDYVVGLSD
jgi:hypothetical protein